MTIHTQSEAVSHRGGLEKGRGGVPSHHSSSLVLARGDGATVALKSV